MVFNYVKWAHKKQSTICATTTTMRKKHQLLQFSVEMSVYKAKGVLRFRRGKEFYKHAHFQVKSRKHNDLEDCQKSNTLDSYKNNISECI